MNGELGGIRGDLAGGGGGVLGISGVRGRSSNFGRTGRGDNGGLVPGLVATVADRGGSRGRDVLGCGLSASAGAAGLCGDSTVIVG